MLKKQNGKRLIWLLAICSLVFAVGFFTIFVKEGYPNRLMVKFAGKEVAEIHDKYMVEGWRNSLINFSADIVFYGDSITRGGDWSVTFPDVSICNLGVSGDTIEGLIQRLPLIEALEPHKVILMIGVNNVSRVGWKNNVNEKYDILLEELKSRGIEVLVCSILPVREPSKVSNQRISEVNQIIEKAAVQHGFVYINIYDSMVDKQGLLKAEYSKDGVHLTKEGYDVWYGILEEGQYLR